MSSPDPTDELASSLSGEQLAGLLRSNGPIVSCVLLQANPSVPPTVEDQSDSNGHSDNASEKNTEEKKMNVETKIAKKDVLTDLITEIQIDTTPKKSMVSQVLGGPFTFLGQYEEEGIVVMIRREQGSEKEGPSDLVINPHELQPPFHNATVYGDILLMRVADEQDAGNSDSDGKDSGNSEGKELKSSDTEQATNATASDGSPNEGTSLMTCTNDEFFLNYTKEEYIHFASRTDILPQESDEDNEPPDDEQVESSQSEGEDEGDDESGDEDEDDDEDYSDDDHDDAIGMMNLLLGQILKRFQEENGRGPDTIELLSMRAALAAKLGIDSIPPVDDGNCSQSGGENGEGEAGPLNNECNTERPASTTEKRKASIDGSDDGSRKKVKFSDKNQVKIIEGLSHSIDEEDDETNDSTSY